MRVEALKPADIYTPPKRVVPHTERARNIDTRARQLKAKVNQHGERLHTDDQIAQWLFSGPDEDMDNKNRAFNLFVRHIQQLTLQDEC